MQLKVTKGKMELEKELSDLDRFVFEFVEVLDRLGIKYVIVSGYVSILFGRNRASEDIDVIVEWLGKRDFGRLWSGLADFDCLNSSDMDDAYDTYISQRHSLRFSRRKKFIPNVEVKFPKVELDELTLQDRKKVVLNGRVLYVSPMELQIPFKLFLGSEKDIEDAKYLYDVFKGRLDEKLLKEFVEKLNVGKAFDRYLK